MRLSVYYITVLISATMFAGIQLGMAKYACCEGFYVVDAISLFQSVNIYRDFGWRWIFGGGFDTVKTFLGVLVLYGWGQAEIQLVVTFFVNVLLISETCRTTHSLGREFGLSTRRLTKYLIIFICLNPFLLSQTVFPNKELPLLYLTSLACAMAVRKRYLGLVMMAGISFWFRDGYGLILLLYAISVFVITFRIPVSIRYGFVAGVFLLVAWLIGISPMDFEPVSRNTEIGMRYYGYDGISVGHILTNMIGNWLNLGLRAQFFSVDGGVFFINIGLWLLGICLLAGVPLGFYLTFKKRGPWILAFLVVCTFLALSVSSFVQPRYLLPALPALIIVLTTYISPVVLISIGAGSLVSVGVLGILDFLPHLQQGVDPQMIYDLLW